MDTIRWILVCVVALPAFACTFANFCIGIRRVLLFTNSGVSWVPVIGTVAAIVGVLLVPKSGTLLSRSAMIAFFVFLCFDGVYVLSGVVNHLRTSITGKHPS